LWAVESTGILCCPRGHACIEATASPSSGNWSARFQSILAPRHWAAGTEAAAEAALEYDRSLKPHEEELR